MTKQINPIETAIAEYLKAKGVTFAAVLTGSGKRDNWECDSWSVSFSREGKERFVTEYHTGIGHRQSNQPMPADIARLGKNIVGRVDWECMWVKPVAPHVAGVLYSVLLDSAGAEQNFLDWCDNFGYDSDSMKHNAIYNACCEILVKARKFFSNEERSEMQDMLQDY